MTGVRYHPAHGGVTIDAADILNSLAEESGIAGLHLLADNEAISGLEFIIPCVWRDEGTITIYLSDMTIVGRDSRRMRFLQWVARPTLPNFRRLWWKAWYGR